MRDKLATYLFALGHLLEKEKIPSLQEDLASLLLALSHHYLRAYLKDPRVHLQERLDVLEEIVGEISNLLLLLITFLWERGDDPLLYPLLEGLKELLEDRERAKVEVLAPSLLSKDHLLRLENLLIKKLDKKVEMTITMDPALLGGLIINIHHQSIDGSLKRRLKRLRREL